MYTSLILLTAFSYINSYYIYGSNGIHVENNNYYRAFDCGSLVQQILRDIGFIKDRRDRSSQMMYDYLIEREDRVFSNKVMPNSIVFFGKSKDKISHVGIAIDKEFMICASSGDRSTTSIAIAIKQDAKVKIQRINYRNDQVAVINLEL